MSMTIVFPEQGAVALADQEPAALQAEQVLVEIEWSLMSAGTELTCLHRRFAPGTHWDHFVHFPFHPGYSAAGHIVALGSAVADFAIGDAVAFRGRHAKRQVAAADQLNRVPEGCLLSDAAWIGLMKIVQVGVRTADPRMGERVVIVGCGILGQLAVQYCALAGCEHIVAVDLNQARLQVAARNGATATIAAAIADAQDDIIAACQGDRPDLVIDVTGAAPVLPSCLSLVRDFGRVVLLGDPGDPNGQHITKDIITRGVRLLGAHDRHAPSTASAQNPWTAQAMQDYALRLVAAGKLRVADLVTHSFKPEDAAQAYALAASRDSDHLGIVFDWRGTHSKPGEHLSVGRTDGR